MSFEALWYSMVSDNGKEPHCTRLSRQPISLQWESAPEIAAAFIEGRAGYRQASITLTREQYWYWPHPLSRSGWWLLPERVARRVFRIVNHASSQACRENAGSASTEQVISVIRRWQRTGTWRRHAILVPRRELIDPVIPRWTTRKRARKPPEGAVCKCGRIWLDGRAAVVCPRMLAHRAMMMSMSREMFLDA